ncbi:MAG: methylamine utilization protein [Pirellulaceae bacterium]
MKKIISVLSITVLFGMTACNKPAPPAPEPAPSPSEYTSPETGTTSSVATPDSSVAAADEQVQAKPIQKFVQADAKLATLRMKFVIDGTPPKPEKIDASRDPFCAALDIKSDDLIVGKEGGIQNVVVYYDERKNKVDIPEIAQKAEAKIHKLDNKNCLFAPQVIAAHPGDTIEVFNSDQTGHNANFNFFDNTQVNFIIPIGESKKVELKLPERGTTEVTCNIHGWMKAYLFVTEHSYVGVTDEDGVLEIPNLPLGTIAFRAWHKVGDFDEVTVDGKKDKWSRNRMEFDLKAGVNDLGVIKVPAAAFKK